MTYSFFPEKPAAEAEAEQDEEKPETPVTVSLEPQLYELTHPMSCTMWCHILIRIQCGG